MPVARLALREHLAIGSVEHGEQRHGAMSNVIMGHAFDLAQSHRQHRCVRSKRLTYYVGYGLVLRGVTDVPTCRLPAVCGWGLWFRLIGHVRALSWRYP
jgi:hypothetical protein